MLCQLKVRIMQIAGLVHVLVAKAVAPKSCSSQFWRKRLRRKHEHGRSWQLDHVTGDSYHAHQTLELDMTFTLDFCIKSCHEAHPCTLLLTVVDGVVLLCSHAAFCARQHPHAACMQSMTPKHIDLHA